MRVVRPLFSTAILLGLVSGCGPSGGPPGPGAPKVGDPAPEVQGEDLAGTRFTLGDYRGKVVLLDFWRYN